MGERLHSTAGWLFRLRRHLNSRPPPTAVLPGSVIDLGSVSTLDPLTLEIELNVPGPATVSTTMAGLTVLPSTIPTAGLHTFRLSLDRSVLVPGAWIHAELLVSLESEQIVYPVIGHVAEDIGGSVSESNLLSGNDDPEWQLLHVLAGHSGDVCGVGFSVDGGILFSASADGTLRLWDVYTGALLDQPQHYHAGVLSLCVYPDGRKLGLGLQDGTVIVQDYVSGRLLWTRQLHQGAVLSIASSPDGQCLATGGDSTVCICRADSGELLHPPLRQLGLVTSVAFSGSGLVLASTSQARVVVLWEVQTGKELRRLLGHQSSVWDAAFSLDGHMLASASNDKTVCLWDATTGRLRGRLLGFAAPVYAVAVSSDGQWVATASGGPNVRIWDARTRRRLAQLTTGDKAIRQLAFSPQQRLLAGASNDDCAYVWKVG